MNNSPQQIDWHFLPVARFAHDLATPIQTMDLCLEVLAKTSVDPIKAAKAVALMQRQVEYMRRVINEAGSAATGQLTKLDFNVSTVLSEAVNFFNLSGGAVSMEIENDFVAHGSVLNFQRVVLNLLKNAGSAVLAFTDKNPGHIGCISVSVGCHNGVGNIRISDNGTGMTPEQKANFMCDGETNSGTPGRGLGMGIVHSIIHDDMGGSIIPDSEIGKGTTFTISLPIASQLPL